MKSVKSKTKEALRNHIAEGEKTALESYLEGVQLVKVAKLVSSEDQDSETPQTKRMIPESYKYDPKALNPLAKMLWALSVSLGHAMTAHRSFTKLKSSTFSPDGLVGGRGYVMSVKEIRQRLYEACEAISAVSDTIHDEINAPHWKPALPELPEGELDRVERLVGEANRNLEAPESEIETDQNEVELNGPQADLGDSELTEEEFGAGVDDWEEEDQESDKDEFDSEDDSEEDETAPYPIKTADTHLPGENLSVPRMRRNHWETPDHIVEPWGSQLPTDRSVGPYGYDFGIGEGASGQGMDNVSETSMLPGDQLRTAPKFTSNNLDSRKATSILPQDMKSSRPQRVDYYKLFDDRGMSELPESGTSKLETDRDLFPREDFTVETKGLDFVNKNLFQSFDPNKKARR